MNRRRWLWLLAMAVVVLSVEQQVLSARLADRGHDIIAFELAGSRSEADEILRDWGAEGRRTARLSLGTDYLYLLAYGALGVLLVTLAGERAGRRGREALARAARQARWLPAAAAGSDALENAALLATMETGDGTPWPLLALVFAVVKFGALAIALLFALVAALAPRLR